MTRFSGLDFRTTEDTFIPRPETELLVEVCLSSLSRLALRKILSAGSRFAGRGSASVLDIGTGSGNIAIALTKQNPLCRIVALDKSEEALRIARRNAQRLGVSDRIEFIQSDLFNCFKRHCPASLCAKFSRRDPASRDDEAISFDIIVSNPPYVPTWEIMTLAEDVKEEPRMALDGGEDGLCFYRKIIAQAPQYLKKGGYLIMEIGYNQAYNVKGLLLDSGDFRDIEIFKDFSNINRVIKAKRWTNS